MKRWPMPFDFSQNLRASAAQPHRLDFAPRPPSTFARLRMFLNDKALNLLDATGKTFLNGRRCKDVD
jgi:hypothetical protein